MGQKQPLEPSSGAVFLLWSFAFYFTGLAYVMAARGEDLAALVSVTAVALLLAPVYRASLRR